eukprot:SAG11_NODE_30312_length_302_cov_0.753695_1_plen_23_part_10
MWASGFVLGTRNLIRPRVVMLSV